MAKWWMISFITKQGENFAAKPWCDENQTSSMPYTVWKSIWKSLIFSSLFTFIRITPVYYLRICGPSQHRKLRKVLKWDFLIRFLSTVYVLNKYSLMDVTSALKVSYFVICHCTCVATSRREQKRATSVWEESTSRKKATALNEMVMTRRFSQSQVIRRKVKRLRFKWMLPLPSR